MKNYLVYLAGPITGVSFDGATDWRDQFADGLNSGFGAGQIEALSPLRGKHYLAGVDSIAASYENIVLSSARGITTRDYNDCKRADLIVVYLLGATKVSIGTVMEIAWAKAFQKPVVAIMEEGNLHDHPMINECVGFRVGSLAEAIDITKVTLLPCGHRK